jgi:glutamyl-tRNA reductase
MLSDLVCETGVHEAVAVSTCNRTELYLLANDPVAAENAALAALSRQANIRPTELFGRIYSKRGIDAVRHLFGVASGLDSMVLGEAEIQGQIKRAYELALVEGATGPLTNRLFTDALAAGKRIRTETSIGRARISVSSVAVELARQTLGTLDEGRVLIIGAGENGELTAKALHEQGVASVFVANRRYDRAIGLAQRFEGEAVRFEELPAELLQANIVVSSTGSPHQIVGRDELAVVMRERRSWPLVLIDIAVPRDIDPTVRNLPGITLYDIDDLQSVATQNLDQRSQEAGRAQALIAEEVERFETWLSSLDVVPTIAALRQRGEAIVQQVLKENESRWESLSQADRRRLGAMARAVVSRLLHEPTLRMKRSAEDESSYAYVEAVRELFGLESEQVQTEHKQNGAVTSIASRRRASQTG